jgi:PAS domain S-box-containing protein
MRDDRRPKLSEREQQLISFAARGYTDTAIAHQLGISEATVNTYWGRVRIKLGPLNRTELVAMALREESEMKLGELRSENQRLVDEIQRLRSESGGDDEDSQALQVLEEAPDPIVVVNSSFEITFCNRACEGMFGYTREELIGRSISSLVPARFRTSHRKHMEVYMRNPERRRMGQHLATLALKKDGEEFPIAAALNAVQTGDDFSVICTLRDVSGDLDALSQFADHHEEAAP